MDAQRLEPVRWWRVEVNKAGTVNTCELVEASERSTRSVLYIRAISRDDALEAAGKWLENRRAVQRRSERRRRLAKKAKGVCQACQKKICRESKVYCAEHLAAQRDYQRTYSRPAERDQMQPAKATVDPLAAMANEHARLRRFRAMTVQLPVVLAVFDQLDGRVMSPYRQWLINEIGLRGGELSEAAE